AQDQAALSALLSGYAEQARLWLRQLQPCHLCRAPAGTPCADSCLAAGEPMLKVHAIPGGEGRIFPASPEAGDRSDMYVLDVLGLTVEVRVRDQDTFVHIDGDGQGEIQRRPVVVEVFNGGENPYGEEWDYCDDCGEVTHKDGEPVNDGADGYDGLCAN